jgi:hypothetical protein
METGGRRLLKIPHLPALTFRHTKTDLSLTNSFLKGTEMKIVKLLKSALIAGALCASWSAGATVAIAYGAEVIDPKTGAPLLDKNEQVKFFVVENVKNGKKAAVAVLEKCRAAFPDIPKGYPLTEFDGHCVIGGVSELKGHTVAVIGAPGDNSHVWVHAMGDKTRDISMGYITRSKILEKKGAKIIYDRWDDQGV